MKRIVCDLCMPHAFFTGTFLIAWQKKTFFTQDCENSKKCRYQAKRNSQMQHCNNEGVDIVLFS